MVKILPYFVLLTHREPKPPHKIEEAETLSISSLICNNENDVQSLVSENSIDSQCNELRRQKTPTKSVAVNSVLSSTDGCKKPGPEQSRNEKSKSLCDGIRNNENESLFPTKSYVKKRDKDASLSPRIESFATGLNHTNCTNEECDAKSQKWICSACTSSNSPSLSSCTQCSAERVFVLDESIDEIRKRETYRDKDPLKIVDYANSDLISQNAADNSSILKGAAYKSPIKDACKENYLKISGDSNPNENGKWLCSLCTFSNWQKSNKCVMCFTSRGESPIIRESKAVLSSKSLCKDPNAETNTDTSLARTITPPIASVLDVDSERGASFNDTRFGLLDNSVNDSYSNGYNNCTLDNSWLNACRGVVDGKLQPVEEYLTSGGDPARQLTQSEVAFLNRPSAFDIGFTLVHLALRCADCFVTLCIVKSALFLCKYF